MSESTANLMLAETAEQMKQARIDAAIRKQIKAIRNARRIAKQAPTLGDILAGRANRADYFAAINGK